MIPIEHDLEDALLHLSRFRKSVKRMMSMTRDWTSKMELNDTLDRIEGTAERVVLRFARVQLGVIYTGKLKKKPNRE